MVADLYTKNADFQSLSTHYGYFFIKIRVIVTFYQKNDECCRYSTGLTFGYTP